MRPLMLIAAAASPFAFCGPALAQVGTTMPPLGVTSTLGTDPSAPVGANGLAPGLSTPVNPVPNGVTGTIAIPSTSNGAGPCSTLATSPTGTFGSPATYDGGGMGITSGSTTAATAATSGGVVPSGPSTSSGISTSTAIAPTSGEVDILGNGGNVGSDGNVRLRLEQHHGIFEPNVNVIHHDEQRRSSRSPVGLHRDQQSRG